MTMDMKQAFIGFIIMVCALGCAGKQKPSISSIAESDQGGIFQQKAIEYEKAGDWQRAIIYLKIAGSLTPRNKDISFKISDLTSKARQEAEAHFNNGLSYLQKNSLEAAQNEFLKALRYNPDHPQALEYVKNKFYENMTLSYSVKAGDTLKTIAKEVYKDSEKDVMIAYLNNLDSKTVPLTGTILKLPVIEMKSKRKTIDVEKAIGAAKTNFEAKQYDKVVNNAEKVLETEYFNPDAEDLLNASYYQMGIELTRQKKYAAALESLNKADPSYKGVQEAIADVRKFLKNDAEAHYRKGVKFYVEEKLDKAIKEWEKTLDLDPDHANAKRDIENARGLIEKLKKVK